jgi:hypothetical protein
VGGGLQETTCEVAYRLGLCSVRSKQGEEADVGCAAAGHQVSRANGKSVLLLRCAVLRLLTAACQAALTAWVGLQLYGLVTNATAKESALAESAVCLRCRRVLDVSYGAVTSLDTACRLLPAVAELS